MDAVAAAVREVSAGIVEPRFTALAVGDVRAKSPGELVTVADEEAEAALTDRLGAILPGVPVVGEEACARDPRLLEALGADRAWLVDPLDGTANFVASSPDWAIMVALVEDGSTTASWIWQPATSTMYTAQRGAGAARNGEQLRISATVRPERCRGAALRRFLGPDLLERIDTETVRRTLGVLGPGRYCAGVDYPLLVEGGQEFILFWRTLPWDHAPGLLLLSEAGGTSRRPDGSAYQVADTGGCGLLAATDDETWNKVHAVLFGSTKGTYLAETTSL